MDFSCTDLELSEHMNNMCALLQDACPSTTSVSRTLLGLPAELRDEIWAYCMHFEDDVEVVITAKRMISCPGGLQILGTEVPKALAPQLLLTNKQIREEGRAIMYSSNNFSIVLNRASYLGYRSRIPLSISVAGGDLASIPSKWTTDTRHCVHQMRRLTLMLLEYSKLEIAAIVGTALGELCEILSFSSNLVSLKVNFLNIGRKELTSGNEHKVLECLGQLKGLKYLEICGLPKRAMDYLENFMRLSKRSEKERNDNPSLRAEKSWGSPHQDAH